MHAGITGRGALASPSATGRQRVLTRDAGHYGWATTRCERPPRALMSARTRLTEAKNSNGRDKAIEIPALWCGSATGCRLQNGHYHDLLEDATPPSAAFLQLHVPICADPGANQSFKTCNAYGGNCHAPFAPSFCHGESPKPHVSPDR